MSSFPDGYGFAGRLVAANDADQQSQYHQIGIPLHAQASSPIVYVDGSCVMFGG
jgi:hypothetical protein